MYIIVRTIRRSPLTIHGLAVLVLTAALGLVSCDDSLEGCERCDFIFWWDSQGELSGTEESCRPIDCDIAICGLCYDISYNANNLPVTGTCDSCENDPVCGDDDDDDDDDDGVEYCPTPPDECSGDSGEPCGCVDLNTNSQHCGACFSVCATGERCVDGECVSSE